MTPFVGIGPGGNGERVERLYVAVVEHGPGDESIAGVQTLFGGCPLVGSTEKNLTAILEQAREIERTSGKRVIVYEFARRPEPKGDRGSEGRFRIMHQVLDELIAAFTISHGGLPSETSVLDLAKWANEQRLQEAKRERSGWRADAFRESVGHAVTREDLVDLIVEISERNVGAAAALITTVSDLSEDVRRSFLLDARRRFSGAGGPVVWVAFKDHCGEDREAFIGLVAGVETPCRSKNRCRYCETKEGKVSP